MVVVLFLLVLASLVAVFIAIAWIRSERGSIPGASLRDAGLELAAMVFPRQAMSRDQLRRRLYSVVLSQVSIGADGRGLVPSTIRVRMAPNDLALLEGMTDWVCTDLVERLVRKAAARRWLAVARPLLTLASDAQRPIGRPVADSNFEPGTVGETEDAASPVAALIGKDGSPSFQLGCCPVKLVIGRSRHCDLVVPGDKVSRKHAEVICDSGGKWHVRDLESLNGIRVNGARVRNRELHDGDELRLTSELAFVVQIPPEPPTKQSASTSG